ncbi:MAG: 3-oxoacyl-ACP synthase [Clostridiales bacterium]|nr:3-oxoacyl-ACP synthase [Clostridiales bacterium]
MVGIAGFGIYLPENIQTAEYISNKSGIPLDVVVNKFGINKKTVPGPEDGTMEMGVKAALDCIKNTGTDPLNIDLIVCIGEEHKEFPLTTSGIYIQEKIGAKNAWAFDIAARCGTAIVALKTAKSLIESDPKINTALIVGGYRNGDFIDYENPRVSFMYDLAAGGGACLLKKDYGRNEILESSIITDGSFARDVGVIYGGTVNPVTSENAHLVYKSLDVMDSEHMKSGLAEKSMPNFVKVIRDCVKDSGYEMSDVSYLAMLHMKKSAHDGILKDLGLNSSSSIYLNDYGHLGQIDQILSTKLALEQNMLKDGIMVWVSAGIGYIWDACAIKWGV